MLNCKLKEDTNQEIGIWDIVTSPYTDIRGVRRIGLFLVVYMEAEDPNDFNNRNLVGLKLTSKDLYANVYRTLVTTKEVPKLTSNSYIYAKPSTLLVNHCRFVSKLPISLCEKVMDKLMTYLNQVHSQTNKTLINKLKGGE